MPLYTKTGDTGTTSIIGGTRLPKFHPRICAYGTLDELKCFCGLLHDKLTDDFSKNLVLQIIENLFVIESNVATEPDQSKRKEAIPVLKNFSKEEILYLENNIDNICSQLPPLHSFILPCGHEVISLCHILRTICRRAERELLALNEAEPLEPQILIYINRLSDLFFALARFQAKVLGVSEREWKTF